MSNNSGWYDENWYAPLKGNEAEALPQQDTAEKPKKKRTALWISLSVLLVICLLIGTSLAFRGTGRTAIDIPVSTDDGTNFSGRSYQSGDDSDGSLPDSSEDFFNNYFTSTTTETAEVNIERAEVPIDFTLETVSASGEELSLQELYSQNSSCVVGIMGFINGRSGYYWGTGVVISSDGLIVTNTHVIEDCDSATVILYDESEYEAKLVGADSISDIAVLKIEAAGLDCAEFGDSTELSVGDRVAAIGNPLGSTFISTMTDGIISAIERGVTYNGRNISLLQTNTALNEGNSGGPLFNMYGQVIGITNMKMMSSSSTIEGIGFAIPSATVKTVVNSILENGEYRGRTSIGITVGTVPAEAMEKYGMPEGLYVSSVTEGTDAEAKGVAAGDVLTEVNGQPVTTTDEVAAIKDAFAVGDTLHMRFWRDGEYYEVDVMLMDTLDVYK